MAKEDNPITTQVLLPYNAKELPTGYTPGQVIFQIPISLVRYTNPSLVLDGIEAGHRFEIAETGKAQQQTKTPISESEYKRRASDQSFRNWLTYIAGLTLTQDQQMGIAGFRIENPCDPALQETQSAISQEEIWGIAMPLVAAELNYVEAETMIVSAEELLGTEYINELTEDLRKGLRKKGVSDSNISAHDQVLREIALGKARKKLEQYKDTMDQVLSPDPDTALAAATKWQSRVDSGEKAFNKAVPRTFSFVVPYTDQSLEPKVKEEVLSTHKHPHLASVKNPDDILLWYITTQLNEEQLKGLGLEPRQIFILRTKYQETEILTDVSAAKQIPTIDGNGDPIENQFISNDRTRQLLNTISNKIRRPRIITIADPSNLHGTRQILVDATSITETTRHLADIAQDRGLIKPNESLVKIVKRWHQLGVDDDVLLESPSPTPNNEQNNSRIERLLIFINFLVALLKSITRR